MEPPRAGPADGAPDADRGRWPVLHPPVRGRVVAWRAAAAVLGALVVVVVVRASVSGLVPIALPGLLVHVVVGVASAVLLWRSAALPALRRADLSGINPAHGPLRDDDLARRMRREIRRGGPLAPELRRPAAVHVAMCTAFRCTLLFVLGAVALGTAGVDADLLGLVFTLALLLPMAAALIRELRIVRAALAHGAVPHVAGVTPGEGPPPHR